MPTASIVLLAALGVLVVVVLASAITVARSLTRTSQAVTTLGRRLEDAEERLTRLRAEVAEVADDVVDVAATVGERARRLEEASASTSTTDPDDEVASHHG